MLSDEVLEKVIERLTTRINKGNEYVLKKMGESVKKIGTLTPSQAQELGQILKYGGDYEKIAQELARLTDMNVADIYKIFEEVAKNDWQFAKQFYRYRGIKYIPFDENDVLKRQVNAIAKITAEEYLNLARTSVLGYAIKNSSGQLMFRNIKQVYHELIDEAILNVSQGKETFDEVMYRKLKEIGESGLKVVYPTTYIGKDGKEHHYVRRLDSAIRMNMKDGLRTLHNETQQQFGKEFKSDGVEISVHLNPAPDHQFVQGHQFSNEEFEKFQTDEDSTSYDGTFYPAESEETGHDRRSIGEYNCYHYVFSIVLGISQPEYTSEQLQEIIDKNNEGFEFEGKHYSNYEGQQLQRKIELEIRKAKDNQILGRNSGNEQLIAESQTRITQLTNKYRKLNQVSGLPSSIDRARVSGYRRIKINNKISNKQQDFAVHYGDLGKARDTNFFAINSSKRSTGHYGTGTYFISAEEAKRLENDPYFSRKDRPKKEVDFSKYNLYKPLIESEGMRLHEGLKAINYGEYDDYDFKFMIDDLIRNGISKDKIDKALKIVNDKRKEFKNKDFEFQLRQDSLSTIFIKELGFNGIDVRKLKNLDNMGYGSVIYDLKNKIRT